MMVPCMAMAQIKQAIPAERINAVMPKVIEWRRNFHRQPELSNREFKTAAIIIKYLQSLGLEVKYPVAKTGVIGILKGGKPGPVIALRADMDGLPVTERNDLPFKSVVKDTFSSQTVGVMHACGHDAHMAMLLGAATVLSNMKKDIAGTVVFLFQPAEEGAPQGEEAGAPFMVKEGAMDNPKVEAVFGLHIMTFLEAGTIGYKPGALMASSDWFTVKVKGKGSHGSQPWLGVDPIVASTQIIQGLQTIVSRQENIAKAPVVISVGSINSGNRPNIIPEDAMFNGTIRTLDAATRKDVQKRIKQTAEAIASSSGATATVTFDEKTLVTFNDSALTERTVPALQAAAGKDNVKVINWITGSEDFSYFGEKAPAFFFFIGGSPKGSDLTKVPAHHTADFFIDEAGLETGVKAFVEIVLHYNAK